MQKGPAHVGIIMDGNGRWAKERGLPRLEGHRQGTETADRIVTHAREIGISHLTLYAFSVENWERPKEEVHGLMLLLREFLESRQEKLLRNQVRLRAIGDIEKLPQTTHDTLIKTMEITAACTAMTLTLALSYGGRDELLRAFKKIFLELRLHSATETDVGRYLDTSFLPDPDLIIRTSGEHRLSNFLLWQSAYAELVFTDTLWPDFTEDDLDLALAEFRRRERRFGRLSEQRGDF